MTSIHRFFFLLKLSRLIGLPQVITDFVQYIGVFDLKNLPPTLLMPFAQGRFVVIPYLMPSVFTSKLDPHF